MHTDITVSIIVPFYNRSKLLNALLETVPDREDLELILVDDHSDEEFRAQRSFSKTKVHLIQNDQGSKFAGTARNKGMDCATGQYLFFADSDDLLNTHDFEVSMNDILSYCREDIILTECASFQEDGRPGNRHIARNWILNNYSQTGDKTLLARLHQPVAKFYRSVFLTENQTRFGDEPFSEDVLFNARIITRDPSVICLPHCTYNIRQGNSSSTNVVSVEAIEYRLKVMCEYNRLLRKYGMHNRQSCALSQLVYILKRHPIEALKLAISSKKSGTRIFPSYSDLKSMRQRKRQSN